MCFTRAVVLWGRRNVLVSKSEAYIFWINLSSNFETKSNKYIMCACVRGVAEKRVLLLYEFQNANVFQTIASASIPSFEI
jgi:ABC-type dipeptide/oligopeptide/nickel transport system permease component